MTDLLTKPTMGYHPLVNAPQPPHGGTITAAYGDISPHFHRHMIMLTLGIVAIGAIVGVIVGATTGKKGKKGDSAVGHDVMAGLAGAGIGLGVGGLIYLVMYFKDVHTLHGQGMAATVHKAAVANMAELSPHLEHAQKGATQLGALRATLGEEGMHGGFYSRGAPHRHFGNAAAVQAGQHRLNMADARHQHQTAMELAEMARAQGAAQGAAQGGGHSGGHSGGQ